MTRSRRVRASLAAKLPIAQKESAANTHWTWGWAFGVQEAWQPPRVWALDGTTGQNWGLLYSSVMFLIIGSV